jgi:hypothetical protein
MRPLYSEWASHQRKIMIHADAGELHSDVRQVKRQ